MNESIHSNVFEGVLVSGKVTVCSPNSKELIVPRGTKFILKRKEGEYAYTCIVHNKFVFVESTEEIDAGIKSLTVYMTCSFTYEADSSTKLDSDKISDKLKKVHVTLISSTTDGCYNLYRHFQSEKPFDAHVYVMDGAEQAATTKTTAKMIMLDINIQGMSITHEQVHEAIMNFLGPEYK